MDFPSFFTLEIIFACGTTTSEAEDVGSAANAITDIVDDPSSPHSPVVSMGRLSSVRAACSTCDGVAVARS
jgi:hypothetical protein